MSDDVRRPAGRGTAGQDRRGGGLGAPTPIGGPRPNRPTPPKSRPVNLESMSSGVIFSLCLHLLILLFAVFGLPNLFKPKPLEDQPIAVQMINMAEFTRATMKNPQPVKEAKLDTPPPDEPSPKPEPPKDQPPTPAPPPPQAEPTPSPPTPTPEPPKPEPKPETPPPVPAPPAPSPEPKPEPPKPEPKPEPPKPAEKPEPPKPQDKPKPKQDQDFDQLLKNLTKQPTQPQKTDQPPKPQKPNATAQTASAQPNAPLGSQVTTSEKDLIAAAVEQCWGIDAGARGISDMKVVIEVELNPDGTVRATSIVDSEGKMSDPAWRAFAERARRAPLLPKCNKLPIPADKFDQLKTFTFTFTPQGVS